MNPPTLFDAVRERDEAMQRVDEAAEPDWKALADEAIRQTCLTRPEFFVDDVWEVGNLPQTREDRALGPRMRAAAKAGWCVRTDRTRPSVRSHGSPKPVWRSLLYFREPGSVRS